MGIDDNAALYDKCDDYKKGASIGEDAMEKISTLESRVIKVLEVCRTKGVVIIKKRPG